MIIRESKKRIKRYGIIKFQKFVVSMVKFVWSVKKGSHNERIFLSIILVAC